MEEVRHLVFAIVLYLSKSLWNWKKEIKPEEKIRKESCYYKMKYKQFQCQPRTKQKCVETEGVLIVLQAVSDQRSCNDIFSDLMWPIHRPLTRMDFVGAMSKKGNLLLPTMFPTKPFWPILWQKVDLLSAQGCTELTSYQLHWFWSTFE